VRLLLILAMTCALVGCKKKAKDTAPDPAPAPGANTNYVPGGGAVQNVRQAARRTVALNDFHQLGLAIKQVELLDGRMPDADRIKAEVRTFPNIPAAIDERVIILTGTNDASGLWAYEVESDTKGGIVLVNGVASRASADEVKQHLARLPKPPAPPKPPVTPKATGALVAPPAPTAPVGNVTVGQKDMDDIRLYIDTASLAAGRMPSVPEVLGALRQAESPAFGLIQKQGIVLTGAKTREGVWAFEFAAAQRGGLVCTQNGVEEVSAGELRKRLAATTR